uniref:2-(3-amino-3-carboxypropyl)histidine synthase subunit 1 n=1 Tax=Panagrolaimus sp. ES5 TaxID=591445 RepID=A0AC34FJH1_9BILA
MSRAHRVREQIDAIINDEILLADMKILPSNYNFEIPKTIWKIRDTKSTLVALQFPEGLLMYSCLIADILSKHTGCETIIMGDVTYGACCVDDYTARSLGCELLVHYGHSCLVPIQDTAGIQMLYIFVNIDLNLSHFLTVAEIHLKDLGTLALVSTIQFVASLQIIKKQLHEIGINVIIPQCNPLSPGEILGCTSPKLSADIGAVVYLGDGRFHLESVMIQNPHLPAFQYNPYSRKLTKEEYGFELMIKNRKMAVDLASGKQCFGLIQGTIGRQGNIRIFDDLEEKLIGKNKEFIRILLSEIFVNKLALFKGIECFAQVACPRLSIDWGLSFKTPLLTPYELASALEYTKFTTNEYPMDFYAYDSRGPWTNNNEKHRPKRAPRAHLSVKA